MLSYNVNVWNVNVSHIDFKSSLKEIFKKKKLQNRNFTTRWSWAFIFLLIEFYAVHFGNKYNPF